MAKTETRSVARKTPYQTITWRCSCGHDNRNVAGHYYLFECAGCGKTHWALEPKFNAGLVAFPHPGLAPVPKPEAA